MAEFNIDDVQVRPVKKEECVQIHAMIVELAVFEKMGDQVAVTQEDIVQDIFGQPTRCSCLVAEDVTNKEQGILGFALYYPAYSTWVRTYLHLEDLYVKPNFRQKGIGKKLYQAFTQIALDMGCARVELEVLAWNKPAKDFYEKVGNKDMTIAEDWRKMRLPRSNMEKFVKM